MPETTKDILKDRRSSSDIRWAFRKLEPVKTYGNCAYATKDVDTLSQQVVQLITRHCLSEASDEDEQTLCSKIKSLTEEIRCSYNEPLIRCLGIMFSKLLKYFYSGVYVNEKAVTKMKTVMGNCPVIFVPSHRSYCDFMVMAYVCFALQVEIPCVAAAIDFSSMKVIGNLLRDCKAFFIRRNFNTDQMYKNIFQRYLQYLVIQGNSPVEFFIEGTRSRTGKALAPKFGLLKMIVDTLIENDVPDIMILPIGISYDRVIEDMLFSYELLGIPKPPESTKGFFKALATMDEKYGNIYINFGEPMYLKSYLMSHNIISWPNNASEILEKLGSRIIQEQQRLQKVLCIHMLSLILHDQYMKKGHICLKLKSAYSSILTLKYFLQFFGAVIYLSDDVTECLYETLSIHKCFFILSEDECIYLNKIKRSTMNTYENKVKGAKLRNDTLDESVLLLRLQQYINPLLCILATPAIVILLIQSDLPSDNLAVKFNFFRNIFSNEFIFIQEDDEKDLSSSLEHLIVSNVIKRENNKMKVRKECWLSFTLSCVLFPFIICYLCTCKTLQKCAEENSIDSIIKSSQLLIEEQISKGYFYHHASLSLDTIYQAVSAMLRLQVISKDNRNGCDIYKVKNYSLLQVIHDELGNLVKSHYLTWSEYGKIKCSTRSKL